MKTAKEVFDYGVLERDGETYDYRVREIYQHVMDAIDDIFDIGSDVRALTARVLSNVDPHLKRAVKTLAPLIEAFDKYDNYERLEQIKRQKAREQEDASKLDKLDKVVQSIEALRDELRNEASVSSRRELYGAALRLSEAIETIKPYQEELK